MIDDLISRQAAIDALEKDIRMAKSEDGELWVAKLNAQMKLTMLPTIELKHGKWIKNNDRSGWHCSCCGKDNLYAYPYTENNERELQDFYCPNCGARMEMGE